MAAPLRYSFLLEVRSHNYVWRTSHCFACLHCDSANHCKLQHNERDVASSHDSPNPPGISFAKPNRRRKCRCRRPQNSQLGNCNVPFIQHALRIKHYNATAKREKEDVTTGAVRYQDSRMTSVAAQYGYKLLWQGGSYCKEDYAEKEIRDAKLVRDVDGALR